MQQQNSKRSLAQQDQPQSDDQNAANLAHVVERNIQALIARRQSEENQQSLQDKIARKISDFTGSMLFVYIHLIIFTLWITINIGWLPLPRFDPSLVILAMAASVEAIFLSTFVLITQNRMAALADKRADLDLQVGLLAEHEITRLLSLVTAIAEKVGVDISDDVELQELAKDVYPEKVLDTIEKTAEQFVADELDEGRRG
jgi:uncharacterized membrane protein